MVDVDETTVLLVAFVILLVPYPLISFGTTEGPASLWWLGLALLAVGGVVPPITRYVGGDEDDEDGAEEDQTGEDGDEGSRGGENGDLGSGDREGNGDTDE